MDHSYHHDADSFTVFTEKLSPLNEGIGVYYVLQPTFVMNVIILANIYVNEMHKTVSAPIFTFCINMYCVNLWVIFLHCRMICELQVEQYY